MIGITNSNIEGLRQRYSQERSEYQEFANHIKKNLEILTRKRKIICSIDARAKEVDSLIKKALLKKYSYEQIKDKAGVRIIVTYEEELSALEKIINASFDVIDSDTKLNHLNSNELGYIGIHFEVKLKQSYIESISGRYDDMICEIQLHTQAQNLWSTVSHKLLYKPSKPLSIEIQRDIYRLSALAGIFDNAVKNVKKDIFSSSPEAKILSILDKNHYRFRGNHSFNRELSTEIIQELQKLLTDEEQLYFEDILNEFVTNDENKLEEFFDYYLEDNCLSLLLSQPESLFVLERLQKDKFALRDIWQDLLPAKMLQDLASAWGNPYRD